MGACVGLVALLVFLPLLSTSSVSARQQLANIANAPSSFPTSAPGRRQLADLPAVDPQLERRPARAAAVDLPGLVRPAAAAVAALGGAPEPGGVAHQPGRLGGAYLLATLGPSNFWLFRWPVRLIEYLYLAAAVLFAVALSPVWPPTRCVRPGQGAIVVLGGYPPGPCSGLYRVHAAGWWGCGARGARGPRRAPPGHAALGVVVVWARRASSPCRRRLPARARGAAPHYPPTTSPTWRGHGWLRGTVLQLATIAGVTTDQMRPGSSCSATCPGHGHREHRCLQRHRLPRVQRGLCIDYRGATAGGLRPAWTLPGRACRCRWWSPARLHAGDPAVPAARRRARPRRGLAVGPDAGAHRVGGSSPSTATGGSPGPPGVRCSRHGVSAPGIGTAATAWRCCSRGWPGRATPRRRRPRGRGRGRPAGLVAVDLPAGSGTLELRQRRRGCGWGCSRRRGGAVAIVQSGVAVAETQVTGKWWHRQEVVAAA